jgi:hypothetical protein
MAIYFVYEKYLRDAMESLKGMLGGLSKISGEKKCRAE